MGHGQDVGPLATRNHRALALPFLRFEPVWGQPEAGHRWTRAGVSGANDLRRVSKGSLVVAEDQETTRLTIGQTIGVDDRTAWNWQVPIVIRGGGFMDPLIDSWHAWVLHWSSPLRDATPFGRSIVSIPGGTYGSAVGLGDASVGVRRRMSEHLAVRAAVELPSGNSGQLLGSGGVDAGLAIDGRWRVASRWALYGGVAVVAQGRGPELDGVRGLADSGYLALVHRANSRDEWIAQWQSERSPLQTGVPGSDATHRLVTLAYRRAMGRGRSLELWFSEDRDLFEGTFPEGANLGPDFTVGLAWTIRN